MNKPALVKPAHPAPASRPSIARPEPLEKPILVSKGRSKPIEAKPSGTLTYWVSSGADVFPSVNRSRS